MSFEYFISKRLVKNETQGKKVSKTIVRISVISIALAIIVNLITIAVVKGFQNQVRNKVSGFGAHLSIKSAAEGNMYESNPVFKNQAFLKDIQQIKGVKSVSAVAYKPVLFQSDRNERLVQLTNDKDTTIIEQNVHGGLLKGVENNYDWEFFKSNLKKGKIPVFKEDQVSNEILISKRLARDLKYDVGDTVRAYFVRSLPVLKKLIIAGIYETGLEEHDKKMAVADLRLVQELNDWGIQATLDVEDTLYRVPGYENQLIVRTQVKGGNGQLRFDWGKGHEIYGAKTINGDKDTTFKVVVSDYVMSLMGDENTSVPDTTYLKIRVDGPKYAQNQFEVEDGNLVKHYIDDTGLRYSIKSGLKTIHVESIPGKGSHGRYVNGFEVKIDDWTQLDAMQKAVKKKVEFLPDENGQMLRVESIRQSEADIFVWLDFLDVNVMIIIVLMILIGIINMGSTLLVLILVRTNFIGILKSLGATNWAIRKIFLYQAAFLILRGMAIGNVIGISLALLQQHFNIIPLNPEVYYLNTVPIELTLVNWLLLNVGTLIVCVAALIIPSIVITRIQPAKAVKFN